MSNLYLTRRVDQKILIGNDVFITVKSINQNSVNLCIDAPSHIAVDREEIRKIKSKYLYQQNALNEA